jgi:hypothetical protein
MMRCLSALRCLVVLSLCACERHVATAAESVPPVPDIVSLKAAAAHGDAAASDRVVSYYFDRASSFPASERMLWDGIAANNRSILGALSLALEYYHRDAPSDCKAARAWAIVVLARTGAEPTSETAVTARRSAEDLLHEIAAAGGTACSSAYDAAAKASVRTILVQTIGDDYKTYDLDHPEPFDGIWVGPRGGRPVAIVRTPRGDLHADPRLFRWLVFYRRGDVRRDRRSPRIEVAFQPSAGTAFGFRSVAAYIQ